MHALAYKPVSLWCSVLYFQYMSCQLTWTRKPVLPPYPWLPKNLSLPFRSAEGLRIDSYHKKAWEDDHRCASLLPVGDMHLMEMLLLPGPLLIAVIFLEFLQKLGTIQSRARHSASTSASML